MNGFRCWSALLFGLLMLCAPSSAYAVAMSEAPGSPFLVESQINGLTNAGDLNDDGADDAIAMINGFASDSVSVLLSDGSGGFTVTTGLTTPDLVTPFDAATGDFDLDGDRDIAIASLFFSLVTFLENDGSGGFTAASWPTLAGGANTEGVASADFDGDSVPDLAVSSVTDQDVRVYLGNGDGTFASAGAPYVVGGGVNRVFADDVTGDGKVDVIASLPNQAKIVVLRGSGTGGFSVAPGSPFTVGGVPWDVSFADVDSDGIRDIAVSSVISDGTRVLRSSATGALTPFTGSPFSLVSNPFVAAVADFDLDGVANDVASAGNAPELNFAQYAGASGFVSLGASTPIGASPRRSITGDFNGDGLPDLVFDWNDSLGVYLNTSEPALTVIAPSDFGVTTTGTIGSPRTIDISNTGDSPLSLGDLVVGGPAAVDYLLTNDRCGGRTLKPGSSCTARLYFAPTAVGTRSATLSVASNAQASSFVAQLSGTGVAPAVFAPVIEDTRPSIGLKICDRTCRAVVVKASRTFSSAKALRAKLTRGSRALARGTARAGQVTLKAKRRVAAGRYRLTLTTRSGRVVESTIINLN